MSNAFLYFSKKCIAQIYEFFPRLSVFGTNLDLIFLQGCWRGEEKGK